MKHSFALSDIVTAFGADTIGTKVTDAPKFWEVLDNAVSEHDFTKDRIPGQGLISISAAVPFVSCGVGPTSDNPAHYVLKTHRGRVSAYLQRKYAAPVTGCAAVVYTREAYLKAPQTPEETARIQQANPDFVLVAILAFSDAPSALSVHRLVSNLAGGNDEALQWTADEIRTKAVEAVEYENKWSVVADDNLDNTKQLIEKLIETSRQVGWYQAEDCTLGNTPFGCSQGRLEQSVLEEKASLDALLRTVCPHKRINSPLPDGGQGSFECLDCGLREDS